MIPRFHTIKSYVLRLGRMSKGQTLAYQELWPQVGVEMNPSAQPQRALFERSAPVVLEIGFGMGDSFFEQAEQKPEWNFVGVEVHRPGVGALCAKIKHRGVGNIRIIEADAHVALQHAIVDASVHKIQIFFPDPWHKRKHHKRRLIQAPFIEQLATKLVPGGILHLATDWLPYAAHMKGVMQSMPLWAPVGEGAENVFHADALMRPITKFEKRGLAMGHPITDLIYQRLPVKQGK